MRSIVLSMCCIAFLTACDPAAKESASAPPADARTATSTSTSEAPASAEAPAPSSAASAAGLTPEANADGETPQTDMQLVPLSKDDIALYLQVMHAAADRVQHPTAADAATLARYKAITQGTSSSDKKAAPSVDDVSAMENGALIAQQMDVLIVRERHIDEKRYDGIGSIIEDIVPNPTMGAAGGASGEGQPVDAPQLSGASLVLQQKIHAAETQDTAILARYRSEIQQVLSVVRNVRNTP